MSSLVNVVELQHPLASLATLAITSKRQITHLASSVLRSVSKALTFLASAPQSLRRPVSRAPPSATLDSRSLANARQIRLRAVSSAPRASRDSMKQCLVRSLLIVPVMIVLLPATRDFISWDFVQSTQPTKAPRVFPALKALTVPPISSWRDRAQVA
jgi:hypothetical protein